MTTSLRTRLLVGTIGGMVLLLACFSLVVYAGIRRALLGEFDRALVATSEILAASVEVEADAIELDFEAAQKPGFNDAGHPIQYQLWTSGGEVIVKSPSLAVQELPRFHGPVGEPARRAFRDAVTRRPHRAVGIQFMPAIEAESSSGPSEAPAEHALVMVVARDARTVHRQLALLRWLLLGAAGATTGLALAVGVLVVRRGLHPLSSIAARIALITENDLDTPIEGASIPCEIAPIRDRLNGLLARLKDAFERERRFSANVAHELRTPLAGMRATVEVTLARHRDADEYRCALSECLRIIDDMQAMVGNLLLLARIEAGQVAFRAEPVALCETAEASWKPFAARARQRGLAFDNRISSDLMLTCDRQSLATVLSNLFSNAVEYGDDGGRVWAQARQADGCIDIDVSNTGCRLSADQAARVFNRFWRADASRSDAGTHCGLGLSLVQRVMQALGGSAAALVEDGTFTLRLTFPRNDHGQ